jgi:hypothetical protein
VEKNNKPVENWQKSVENLWKACGMNGENSGGG